MTKRQFLDELKTALRGLPQDDVNERLSFYEEMIDDRMEEGLSEEQAVAGVGSVGEIAAQTVAEVPIFKIVKERVKPSRTLRAWEIILLILGFPLWFPLLIAACSVILALYAVVFSLIVSLWAVEISLWAGALGGVCAAIVYAANGNPLQGVAAFGAGLFLIGLSVFAFFGCVAAVKGIGISFKKTLNAVKTLFIKKESAK